MHLFPHIVRDIRPVVDDLLNLIEIKGGNVLKVSETTWSYLFSEHYYKKIVVKSEGMTGVTYGDIYKLFRDTNFKIIKVNKKQRGFCISNSSNDIIEIYKLKLIW